MTHMIGEISLLVAVLLLSIQTHDNDKQIKDLKKRVEMLTMRTWRNES